MRALTLLLLLASAALAQTPQLPAADATRIHEFYRLAAQLQDRVWPDWSRAAAPLLLVTDQEEFLTHHQHPPKDFTRVLPDLYVRPRQFPINLLATFPAFGPPSVIVIGEPANTSARTSTPWLITLMHEHFHQLQDGHPGFYEAVNGLGLARGDTTGMWMLNYPFPYDNAAIDRSFAGLRDLLLATLAAPDGHKFRASAARYAAARAQFFAQLSPDDRKYFNFQLWKEGIARYVQIKCAEAAAAYRPTPAFAALPDYTPFGALASTARADTLKELGQVDLARAKREAVYPFGAAEGLLLDRLHPGWTASYFDHLFTLDPYF